VGAIGFAGRPVVPRAFCSVTPDDSLGFRIDNVGPDRLPVAAEQYVCGDAWKVDFPQSDGQFSLRFSIRVVEATETRIVWEPTFAIHTSLLDTAPSLELSALGSQDESVAAKFPSPARFRRAMRCRSWFRRFAIATQTGN